MAYVWCNSLPLGVYVFSELLENENIKSLEGTEFDPSYQLLKLFAYGNYLDYKSKNVEGVAELEVCPPILIHRQYS